MRIWNKTTLIVVIMILMLSTLSTGLVLNEPTKQVNEIYSNSNDTEISTHTINDDFLILDVTEVLIPNEVSISILPTEILSSEDSRELNFTLPSSFSVSTGLSYIYTDNDNEIEYQFSFQNFTFTNAITINFTTNQALNHGETAKSFEINYELHDGLQNLIVPGSFSWLSYNYAFLTEYEYEDEYYEGEIYIQTKDTIAPTRLGELSFIIPNNLNDDVKISTVVTSINDYLVFTDLDNTSKSISGSLDEINDVYRYNLTNDIVPTEKHSYDKFSIDVNSDVFPKYVVIEYTVNIYFGDQLRFTQDRIISISDDSRRSLSLKNPSIITDDDGKSIMKFGIQNSDGLDMASKISIDDFSPQFIVQGKPFYADIVQYFDETINEYNIPIDEIEEFADLGIKFLSTNIAMKIVSKIPFIGQYATAIKYGLMAASFGIKAFKFLKTQISGDIEFNSTRNEWAPFGYNSGNEENIVNSDPTLDLPPISLQNVDDFYTTIAYAVHKIQIRGLNSIEDGSRADEYVNSTYLGSGYLFIGGYSDPIEKSIHFNLLYSGTLLGDREEMWLEIESTYLPDNYVNYRIGKIFLNGAANGSYPALFSSNDDFDINSWDEILVIPLANQDDTLTISIHVMSQDTFLNLLEIKNVNDLLTQGRQLFYKIGYVGYDDSRFSSLISENQNSPTNVIGILVLIPISFRNYVLSKKIRDPNY